MRILVLNSLLYTPNGYVHKVKSIRDTMIYNMCLGFAANGHNVTLAAAQEYEPTEIKDYDFEILFFKSSLQKIFIPTALPFSLELFTYLRNNHYKYNLIISSEVFSFPSLFASLLCPEKTVIWHELALHPSFLFKIPSKVWYNVICRLLMGKVFVIPRSVSARDFISSYCPKVSSVCVEHGINLAKFSYSQEKDDYFTYVGQLIKRKNVEYLIKVFSEYIKVTGNKTKLFICGDGPQRDDLIKIAKEKHTENQVIFLGKLSHNELNNIIMKSMGGLISTRQDNNMVSIPESIVSGTPILTNSIPTNSYIIKENELGIVKDEWGVDELERLVKNNNYYVSNCIKYREKLSANYSSNQLIGLYMNQLIKH